MQQQEQKKEDVQVNTSPDTTNQDAPLLPRLYLFYEFLHYSQIFYLIVVPS